MANTRTGITIEEARLLSHFDNEMLFFLKEIGEHKQFPKFRELINTIIDMEKNQFFGENEASMTAAILQTKHAYARGGIAKLIMIVHLAVGAGRELARREEERKKRSLDKSSQE